MLYKMAKNISLVFLAGVTTVAAGSTSFHTVTNKMECAFNNFCGWNSMILTVQAGDDYSVEVSPSSLLQPVYSGGELSWKGLDALKSYKGKAKVVVTMPNTALMEIQNVADGDISVWKGFDFGSSGLVVTSSGSGNIQFEEANGNNVAVTARGSGDVTIVSGDMHELNILHAGSGNVNGRFGVAEEATVSANGSGDTTLNFVQSDDTKVTLKSVGGSGNVHLCNPSEISGSVNGSGDLLVTPASFSGLTNVAHHGSGDVLGSSKECPTLHFSKTIETDYYKPLVLTQISTSAHSVQIEADGMWVDGHKVSSSSHADTVVNNSDGVWINGQKVAPISGFGWIWVAVIVVVVMLAILGLVFLVWFSIRRCSKDKQMLENKQIVESSPV